MRLKNWKTKPMWSRRNSVRSRSEREEIATPSITTSPELGWSMPERRLSSVDLPDPLRPIRTANSPRWIATSVSHSTIRRRLPSS